MTKMTRGHGTAKHEYIHLGLWVKHNKKNINLCCCFLTKDGEIVSYICITYP